MPLYYDPVGGASVIASTHMTQIRRTKAASALSESGKGNGRHITRQLCPLADLTRCRTARHSVFAVTVSLVHMEDKVIRTVQISLSGEIAEETKAIQCLN